MYPRDATRNAEFRGCLDKHLTYWQEGAREYRRAKVEQILLDFKKVLGKKPR